jgi:hypothetical protein
MPSFVSPKQILASMDTAFATAPNPGPDLAISQWANQYCILSRVSGADYGRWRRARPASIYRIRQKKSWVDSGSGSLPSEWYRASSSTR